jgi:replicative DNA helicase
MENVTFIQAEQQVVINALHGQPTSLTSADLQSASHQVLFNTALDLMTEGITPDLVTMNHRLGKEDRLEEAGGVDYLTDLYGNPAPKNVEPYEDIVREESTKQKVIIHARELLERAEQGASASDLLIMAQTRPMNMSINSKTENTVVVQDAVFEILEEVSARRKGIMTKGIPTPWDYLNKKTNGLQPGDLIVLAGRPAMGKTAMGGQLATFTAEKTGPVFVGSLEMDSSSMIERMLSGEARVDSLLIRSGRLSDREFERLQSAAEEFQGYHPILVNDTPRLSATELRVEMIKQHAKFGLKLAVIDYLGLLKEDRPGQARYKEVGDSVKILRATARELQIPVVLLCQLNRGVEGREDKRPTLSDLKESGEIEQDSDVVLMLYRGEYYCANCIAAKPCNEDHQGLATLLIRKQRKGPIGATDLVWLSEYTTFKDMASGPQWEGIDDSDMNVHVDQEPEIIEESPQASLGYKTGDGSHKDFPNPV